MERDAEEERLKKQHAAKAKAKVEAAESADSKTSSAPRAGKELEASADPLSSFFSEIQGDKDNAPPAKVERVLNDKYTTQELGTPKEQMDRLLQHNYKWKNLNAFDALQLGGDATVEDIKQSYVMLCTLYFTFTNWPRNHVACTCRNGVSTSIVILILHVLRVGALANPLALAKTQATF